MDSKMIDRINTLHHKAQSVGLTEEEKIEQAKLRKEYIATIKMNLAATCLTILTSRKPMVPL